LSIVAGRTMATIAADLTHAAIVRAMPNTPAQIGEGMTVWTATPAVNQRQRDQAQTLLKAMGQEIYVAEERALDMATAMGQEIYVAEERALDMATAVSGTGPTYVFRAGWLRPWSSRQCWVRFSSPASRKSTWPNCATWSPHRAAPAPTLFTNWKKAACAPFSPRPSGQLTRSQSCWASRTISNLQSENCRWMKVDGWHRWPFGESLFAISLERERRQKRAVPAWALPLALTLFYRA